MTYPDYIYQILGFVGLPALFTLYLTEKVKGSIKSTYDSKLEEIKKENTKEIEEVKKEHSKEISQFQTELDHLKSRESFKFTKLHEKRLEVLAKSYQCVAENLILLDEYVNPTKKVLPEGVSMLDLEKELRNTYRSAHNDFHTYFSGNVIYFSEELETLFNFFFVESTRIFKSYDKIYLIILKGEIPDQEDVDTANLIYKKIPEIIKPIQKNIQIKFRELLGE